MKKHLLYAIASLLTVTATQVQAVTEVDVELQLLLDISGSVSRSEYNLQLQGYQSAFDNSALQQAILGGGLGKIAVQVIMWSGSNQQEVSIDWTLIDSTTASSNFAAQIAQLARPFYGMTAIGSAIDYSYSEFATNDFSGEYQIIDVSGDGTQNSGSDTRAARDAALAAGVDTINGIVISTDQDVIDYYVDNVAGGSRAFVLQADDYTDFQQAISNKLVAEVRREIPTNAVVVPEPKTLWILLYGLIALYGLKEKK